MDLDRKLEGFADYANDDVRALFNSFNTDEDRKWAWFTLSEIIKYFPTLDHYTTGGIDKSYIDIRIGRKDKLKKGTPILYLSKESKEKGHAPCLWVNGNYRNISSKNQSWYIKELNDNKNNVTAWIKNLINLPEGNELRPKDYRDIIETAMSNEVNTIYMNTILYGPPGTGKTYHTINKALEIIDPDFYSICKNDRKSLKERFDKLCEENKIIMTTFHQSYSYEDFVEGLSAETKDGRLVYSIKKGIFKTICEHAAKSQLESNFDEVYTKFCNDIKEQSLTLRTLKRNNAIDIEVSNQQNLVVIPHTETKARMTITKENLRQFILSGVVGDWRTYTRVIKKYLEDEYHLVIHSQSLNYVLIIDEINRGNVSNIFGELITLIEESKRAGKDEALSVTLPYSKETFSVPSNLYIVGTMNTADRSLTQIDTALRRRFHFEEMMPNPDLLEGLVIDNINICNLLKCLNERIEALYDREHTLGHAFFMELLEEDKKNIDTLAAIFKNKVIPLLQEYFFDDWGKIQLILGDTVIQKKEKFIQFAMPVPDNLVTPDAYKINYAALDKSETYTAIYVNCPSTVND